MARERIESNGLSLSIEHRGEPTGPAVLFLHGITAGADTWQESIDRLGDRFDCWALDFRHHGESDRGTGSPTLADYAADAAAALQHIGRRTIVVGHSLGGITAAHLAHTGHPLVAAVFLEDPPLFLIDVEVFAGTVYPKLFTMLRDALIERQAAGSDEEAFIGFAGGVPSPMGGVSADHFVPRQLRSRGRQYAQVDPAVLDSAINGELFAGLDPYRPIACPVTLLAANEAYGAAILPGDAERLRQHSPHAEVIEFPEVGHGIHASTVSEARFLDELDRFASANR
ncbi:MAG: alpha/beta fold hydrolase [Acidimicrobiales bacterium]|nr:alpha/beta fold hydrolase [Acidimicrobiales bacterium]